MRVDLSFRSFFPALVLLLMTACASPRDRAPSLPAQPEAGRSSPELPYPPPRDPVVGDILHLPTGHFVAEDEMLRIATEARVVYVGETHDNPASHRQQLALLRALAQRYPGEVALAMEMFNAGQQDALDLWVAGELDEREFLRMSRWYDVWRMDFDYYRDLLMLARDLSIPVIGINADKSRVREVRTGDAPPPSLDLSDPYHRSLVEAIFGGHMRGELDFETFLQVQALWDETMAEGVADYLAANPQKRMLVVAGANHVRYGFGIPRRAFRRLPHSYALVGSLEIEIPDDKQDRMMAVDLPSFPMPPYHFIAFTRYEDLGKERVRIGVMLEEEDGAVVIRGVVPGSAGQKGGVREGERIMSLDGAAVENAFDVIHAVRQKKPGESLNLTLMNEEGELRDVEIRFDSLSTQPGDSRP